ncbi:Protein vip1 [Coemansia javaensis]|uniref:Protein vip1 n=1 Tax=Coemansia javaensis TaxID=2761396 RepID=A0A9W8HFM0_9FUNG|nr:Protein vip1 [Coemansia javaensis]
MTSIKWNTPLPATPDGTYVLVERIPLSASADTVREFFTFCGDITVLELQKNEAGFQSALIKFAAPEAAKTALLLSHALINHEAIEVMPLFPEALPPGTPPAAADAADNRAAPPPAARAPTAADTNYEGKPALYVAHELLAAGYMLGERVLSRASEFDSKYRVTDRTQTQARSLDSTYKVTSYLHQWDEKFKISSRAKSAIDKMQNHPTGQKLMLTVNDAYQSALELSRDARDIAERKRANNERIFGKIPLPRSPSGTQQQQQQQPPQQQQQPPAYTGSSAANDYSSAAVAPAPVPPSDEKQN